MWNITKLLPKIISFIILISIIFIFYSCNNPDITIVFNSNGGSNIENYIVSVNSSNIDIPNTPSKEGYIFQGWFIDNNTFEIPLTIKSIKDKKGTINVYAKWAVDIDLTPLYYNVTFNTKDGSIINSITVTAGEILILPENPVKAGHNFLGWYLDEDYINPLEQATLQSIQSNITLYAKWIVSYQITFDYGYGYIVNNVNQNEMAIKPDQSMFPIFNNYYIDNWYIDNDYLIMYDFNKEVISNLTLYGHWRNIFEYDFINNQIFIKGINYIGTAGEIIIPSNIEFNGNCYNVIAIRDSAFKDNHKLRSVIISDGIEIIGTNAFNGCDNLNSIIVPDSVKSVGSGVLDKTSWYNNLNNGIIYLNKIVYGYKGNMPLNTFITINEEIICIAERAFINQHNLIGISFPDSITEMGKYAFMNCINLESIRLSNNIINLSDWIFYNCVKLNNVILPSNIETISNNAFNGCVGLDNIILPNKLKSIGNRAFYGCRSLYIIDLPENLILIGDNAFDGCHSLKSALLNSTIPPIIGSAIFNNVNDNIKLFISNNEVDNYKNNSQWNIYNSIIYSKNLIIGQFAINNHTLIHYLGNEKNIVIPYDINTIGSMSFYKSNLYSVTFPSGIINIEWMAFYGNEHLSEVYISETIENIEERAFGNCIRLNRFYVNQDNNYYSEIDGVLFNKNISRIIQYPIAKNIIEYSIPSTVNIINRFCFEGAIKLINIIIPSSINVIEHNAFYRCSQLITINLPTGVSSIGEEVFTECSSLISINVTEENNHYASIDGVLFNKDITQLIAYPSDRQINTYTMPDSVISINKMAFYKNNNIVTIIIPDNVISIGFRAFGYCNNLKVVVIGTGVEIIGYGAFKGSEMLEKFTIMTEIPPIIGDYFLRYTSNNLVIYLPHEKLEAYQENTSWNEYSDRFISLS